MKVSVVIRTRNEADRLRLTLASLMRQTMPAQVVVVDDGSADHTARVLDEAAASLDLTALSHKSSQGRSAASNAGARAARGDVLVFLDGDTLAHPEMVQRHAELHAADPRSIGRGENFHLRCTRFLRDPETGTAMSGEEDRVARMSRSELERLCVTRSQVLEDFPAIEHRAAIGIYPGAGPRQLQEIELAGLRENPSCSVLWAAASGSNQSVPREAFIAAGGFNVAIDINEHRELALRLCSSGLQMRAADGAFSYHMTHRSGWRDPLQATGWEAVFLAAHPLPEVALMPVLWASLSPQSPIPEAERILTLPALEAAARERSAGEIASVRSRLGLQALLPV